jgi:SH3 domain-containing YSC84-like protein 1
MKKIAALLVVLLISLGLNACRSSGEFTSEPELLIEKSRVTIQNFLSDPNYPGLVDLSTRAKGIVIIPNMLKGGFLLGGRGGNAVMLARNEAGQWSPPAFYTMGGISYGFQIGLQYSEIIIMIMSDKGLQAVMNRQATLGADAGLAIGELGKGLNAATGLDLNADMYAFARNEGLFVGISVEGSVISPRHTWNKQLYGQEATPEGILIERLFTHPAGNPLLAAMP